MAALSSSLDSGVNSTTAYGRGQSVEVRVRAVEVRVREILVIGSKRELGLQQWNRTVVRVQGLISRVE